MIKYRCYGCKKEIETMSDCWVKCTKCSLEMVKVSGEAEVMKELKKKRRKKNARRKS